MAIVYQTILFDAMYLILIIKWSVLPNYQVKFTLFLFFLAKLKKNYKYILLESSETFQKLMLFILNR